LNGILEVHLKNGVMHRHYIHLKKEVTVPAFASLECPSCQQHLNLIQLFSKEEVQVIVENILGEDPCGLCKGRLHIDSINSKT
jgi:hypothetical protein